MENVNVVSTPNITGNIGSCTTQVVKRTTDRNGFFTETVEEIATNSCTGDVSSASHWEFTESAGFTIFGILVIGIILAVAVSIRIADSY